MSREDEKKDGYNGWKNYETWAVNLWLDNEEGAYHYWRCAAKEEKTSDRITSQFWTPENAWKYRLAGRLKEEITEGAPDLGASLWTDLLGAALAEVDWDEIAQAMIDNAGE